MGGGAVDVSQPLFYMALYQILLHGTAVSIPKQIKKISPKGGHVLVSAVTVTILQRAPLPIPLSGEAAVVSKGTLLTLTKCNTRRGGRWDPNPTQSCCRVCSSGIGRSANASTQRLVHP
jgi:hypothetical protein